MKSECALQVVPSVPNLYKNSFTYHSASTVPADFQECGDFLGALAAARVTLAVLPLRTEGEYTHRISDNDRRVFASQTRPGDQTRRCWCTA
jgi:hypothetical protein